MDTTILQACLRRYANINEEPYELPNIIESFAYDYESDLDYQAARAYTLDELNEDVMCGRWDCYELYTLAELGMQPYYQVVECAGYCEIAAFDGVYDDFVIENIAVDLLLHCSIRYDFDDMRHVFEPDCDFPQYIGDGITQAVVRQACYNYPHRLSACEVIDMWLAWKRNH